MSAAPSPIVRPSPINAGNEFETRLVTCLNCGNSERKEASAAHDPSVERGLKLLRQAGVKFPPARIELRQCRTCGYEFDSRLNAACPECVRPTPSQVIDRQRYAALGEGESWFLNSANLARLLEWLDANDQCELSISWLKDFLDKPWKWSREYDEMVAEKLHREETCAL